MKEVKIKITKDDYTIIVTYKGKDYDYATDEGAWDEELEEYLSDLDGVCSDIQDQL